MTFMSHIKNCFWCIFTKFNISTPTLALALAPTLALALALTLARALAPAQAQAPALALALAFFFVDVVFVVLPTSYVKYLVVVLDVLTTQLFK